jgi:transcriptional regulator with XRE-family HTH domain
VAADSGGADGALGAYIKLQRQLANLSIRQLADLAEVSNPYLSQVERGLHEPSVRVLRSIAHALNTSAEVMLEQVGSLDKRDRTDGPPTSDVAIRNDPLLTSAQKQALLGVYRSYLSANEAEAKAKASGSAAG